MEWYTVGVHSTRSLRCSSALSSYSILHPHLSHTDSREGPCPDNEPARLIKRLLGQPGEEVWEPPSTPLSRFSGEEAPPNHHSGKKEGAQHTPPGEAQGGKAGRGLAGGRSAGKNASSSSAAGHEEMGRRSGGSSSGGEKTAAMQGGQGGDLPLFPFDLPEPSLLDFAHLRHIDWVDEGFATGRGPLYRCGGVNMEWGFVQVWG